MKNLNRYTLGIFLAVILLALLIIAKSAVTVGEWEQVVVTQFGKPVGTAWKDPGLHWIVPFVQKTTVFDKRYLEWDGDPTQIPTRDKRFISVDAYARWRITDPLLFFQRVREERSAQSRLDDLLDGALRNTIANHNIEEVVRSSNRVPARNDVEGEEDSTVFSKIEVGRARIAKMILEIAAPKIKDLGIELVDLRFKRLNYIDAVQQKIFERMIAERKKVADRFRAEGQGEAARILGEKERDLKRIESEAWREAESIRGAADGEAASIYSASYDKSGESREFYAFTRKLETLKNSIGAGDFLILSTDGDPFNVLESNSK